MAEALTSRGQHQKLKPAAVMDYNKYKIGINLSDQMLAYTHSREKW
jgi:hypothetical protein